MHNGHILGSQHLVDGMLLSIIQIRKAHIRKRERLSFLVRIEEVA